MQTLAQHTRLSPDARISKSNEYLRQFHKFVYLIISLISFDFSRRELCDIFGRWQVQLDRNLVKVIARELPAEQMFAHENRPFNYDANSGDWARSIKDYGSLQSVDLNTWMLIFSKQDYKIAEEFFKTIQRMARAMKMTINTPYM